MRLPQLLAALSDAELERLAVEHVRTDERLPRPQLCNFLEGALSSYRFVNDLVLNRQPPAFAMLTLLLEAPGYQLSNSDYRDRVIAETRRIMELVDAGDLVARDRQLQLYRRSLYEARRNDLDLNSSESALLAVLRREQGIAQVEHFLIEHHQDLREFWDSDDSFLHELNALRSAGLLFDFQGSVLIPEELAPAIWQTLGIDMPKESARRLFGFLSNSEVAGALETAGSRTSGSKEARVDRLILEYVQPRLVLKVVNLSTLKDICRETDASVSGNKEDLIERIVAHFAEGKDQRVEEPPEPQRLESRQLSQIQFETMFSALLHQELTDILRRLPELRQTGTKETRIKTLWDAHLSEVTLLRELMNRQLEDLLHRLGLRLSGSKQARIARIIEYFAIADTAHAEAATPLNLGREASRESAPLPDAVVQNQIKFRQKASNLNSSLQPWLEELLDGKGLVRCYATEDAVPTKQLKNKLSQAAAAHNGLLILLLADKEAFLKAREALAERWMNNAEWSKSVACVALGYPPYDAAIVAMVERTDSPWSDAIRTRLFPAAEILRVGQEHKLTSGRETTCSECGGGLPPAARYCPCCGKCADSSARPAAR